VSVDPTDGAVRALVGGPGFERSKFNLVTDGIGRQPGSSFKPFDLVAALEAGYSVRDTINASPPCPIPNPGGVPNPYLPHNVDDRDGKNIFKTKVTGTRAIDADIARQVTQVLHDVTVRGTGTRAALRDRVVAGKTGTAEDNHDAWFVGYTPQLATAVWMGAPV